ncbi:LOW QUALITY PROTEIN: C2 calcium-dependent domain-containing protein 4A [Menidia menidia]
MWVVEKIRLSVERTNLPIPSAELSFRIGDIMLGEKSDKSKRISLCPNIITPDNIPEFCIPPTILTLQEMKNPEQRATACTIKASPEPEVTFHEQLNPHIIQVESVDESPCDGCSDEETTNADPQSQAALSLPHLAKAQTSYGFCTLLESPHTRRKESIFHSDPGSSPLLLPRSRSSMCTKISPCSSPSSSPSSFSLNTLTSKLSPRGYTLNQAPLDSDTTSSTESSPFSSPLLNRYPAKSSLFKALSHELLLSRNMRKAMVSRNNSLSTDEGSSTDNSPNIMRRASEGLAEGLPSSYSLAPPNIFPMDLTLHKERILMKERIVPIGKDGNLRLSAEYCPDNQRLRVQLISAEGLYPLSVDPKLINCSVSLSLVPGKVQKQRSTVIRKSRNPIFNEDFFFDSISEEDLNQRSLRFKVVNKMSTLKRDYLLGDCDLLLSSIVSS